MTEDELHKAAELAKNRKAVATMQYFMAPVEIVEARRLDALRTREAMLVCQKAAGQQRDSDSAKFFKGLAQEAQKEYRGACLILGQLLNNPPGDSLFRRVDDWPPDLLPYALRAGR